NQLHRSSAAVHETGDRRTAVPLHPREEITARIKIAAERKQPAQTCRRALRQLLQESLLLAVDISEKCEFEREIAGQAVDGPVLQRIVIENQQPREVQLFKLGKRN